MKAQEIFNQLITYLPLQTNLFNDILNVSLTCNASKVVTAITSIPHGLITGNVICIKNALEKLSIVSITSSNGVATATTATNHDLTMNFQSSVNISGAVQSEYNGIKTLLSVPTRKTFTFEITGTPVSPATGTIYLNELRADGYNGMFNITKINDTSFTYTALRVLGIQTGTAQLSLMPRIFVATDIERVVELYSEKQDNNYCLFIQLAGTTASRDRNVRSDATYEYMKGREYTQQLMQQLNLYIFAPTTNTSNAGNIMDTMQDIRKYLINCLAGFNLNNLYTSNEECLLTFVSDDIELYNGAFLVYRFTFETIFEITKADIFHPLDSLAINSLEINYLNSYEVNVKKDVKSF